jgi:hypothetical protein
MCAKAVPGGAALQTIHFDPRVDMESHHGLRCACHGAMTEV